MIALIKRIQFILGVVIVTALLYLIYNGYQTWQFDRHPVSEAMQQQLDAKKQQIIALVKRHYGIHLDVPLMVTSEFKNRLYGLTAFDGRNITIYLNKARMRESFDYVLDEVIAHEYAHALIFRLGFLHPEAGHGTQWQEACMKLGGRHCKQYVKHADIVMGKLPY